MSISMNDLPNELLLKICRLLSINDFIHLSSTSHHFYQFGQNFREEMFNAKTRLLVSDRHNKFENKLLQKCVQLSMEQSSEQITTELAREKVAELTINLQGTNFEILNQFANITQLIVSKFDTHNEEDYHKKLIPLLSPFPQLRMLKIVTYVGLHTSYYMQLFNKIAEMNLAELRHLSIYCRKQPGSLSELFHENEATKQMFCRLNEFYLGGTFRETSQLGMVVRLSMPSKLYKWTLDGTSALRRLGLNFDKAQTCFQYLQDITEPFLGDQITHLTMHSLANDYDTLTDQQMEHISKIFPQVQNFIPIVLDDKIKLIRQRNDN